MALDGLDSIAGRVNIGGEDPGGRFGARLDTRGVFSGGAQIERLRPSSTVQVGVPGHAPGAYLTAGNFVQTQIPSATWGNSQVGFRLHTLVSNTEMTMFYLWSHDYSPIARINNRIIVPSGVPGLNFRQVDMFYPQYQAFGITGQPAAVSAGRLGAVAVRRPG